MLIFIGQGWMVMGSMEFNCGSGVKLFLTSGREVNTNFALFVLWQLNMLFDSAFQLATLYTCTTFWRELFANFIPSIYYFFLGEGDA